MAILNGLTQRFLFVHIQHFLALSSLSCSFPPVFLSSTLLPDFSNIYVWHLLKQILLYAQLNSKFLRESSKGLPFYISYGFQNEMSVGWIRKPHYSHTPQSLTLLGDGFMGVPAPVGSVELSVDINIISYSLKLVSHGHMGQLPLLLLMYNPREPLDQWGLATEFSHIWTEFLQFLR